MKFSVLPALTDSSQSGGWQILATTASDNGCLTEPIADGPSRCARPSKSSPPIHEISRVSCTRADSDRSIELPRPRQPATIQAPNPSAAYHANRALRLAQDFLSTNDVSSPCIPCIILRRFRRPSDTCRSYLTVTRLSNDWTSTSICLTWPISLNKTSQ